MSFTSHFIQTLKTHNQQAFSRFYTDTFDWFWRFLQSRYFLDDTTKDDLIHDYYIKIRRVIDQYDDAWSFETRYWTIFRNHIKDYFKASRETHNDLLLEPLSTDAEQLTMVELEFKKEQLDKALWTLDNDSALIVTLRYLEQKEYKEIAMIVWMTESTVRKRLSRALKALKQEILKPY